MAATPSCTDHRLHIHHHGRWSPETSTRCRGPRTSGTASTSTTDVERRPATAGRSVKEARRVFPAPRALRESPPPPPPPPLATSSTSDTFPAAAVA
eukprot:CAMPEP_0198673918 /NCGR_PEP_ID=MMETSP1467-20131203/97651_1 /TAXON_ID=1462469 /ORGANISM="unid. sp., Strain CCMP2135" /LENGTH=95 /DNA_ID=CAMNT_0044410805 /DNA_START=384 /DNA_END=671 /DNA_ORIENTATION=-